MRYSTHDISRYKVPGMMRTDINVIAAHPQGVAIWNLFWMSNPSLDGLIGCTTKDWYLRYTQVPDLSSALIEDVVGDAVLAHRLLEHPNLFRGWWRTEPHHLYRAYRLVPDWAGVVAKQAEKASLALLRQEFDVHRRSRQRFNLGSLLKGGQRGEENT